MFVGFVCIGSRIRTPHRLRPHRSCSAATAGFRPGGFPTAKIIVIFVTARVSVIILTDLINFFQNGPFPPIFQRVHRSDSATGPAKSIPKNFLSARKPGSGIRRPPGRSTPTAEPAAKPHRHRVLCFFPKIHYIASLRTVTAYKNEENYPESKEDRNFDRLKELMKNCTEK